MSRVQTNPDFFKQVKALEQRISKLERIASTTTLKDVNTTGLTSAQIDAAVFAGSSTPSVGAQAADGLIIRDSTNNLLLVRQGGNWSRNSLDDASGWQLPGLLNSWAFYGSQLNKGFRKVGNEVFFAMSLYAGTPGTAAFSIDASYAPPAGSGTVDVNGLGQGPTGLCVLTVPAGGGDVYLYADTISGAPSFWAFYGSYLIN